MVNISFFQDFDFLQREIYFFGQKCISLNKKGISLNETGAIFPPVNSRHIWGPIGDEVLGTALQYSVETSFNI